MNKKIVSVVIPNWNGSDVITECIDSIKNQNLKPLEVIVVDNGSTDGSVEIIKKQFPEVKLISLEKNIGFAGAVNKGIKAAKGDYVFLLNNDATLEKNCLEELIKTAQTNKSDITQCTILTNGGKLIDSVGDEYSIWGLPYPGMRNQPSDKAPKKDKEIFSASGGASLYKKSLFNEIGYFDEDFFAYYEDVDISIRAHMQNKKIFLSTKAIVHHKMNYTAKKLPGFSREMAIKNSLYLYWKNIPFPLSLKILPKFIYCNLRMTGAALTKGHPIIAIKAHIIAIVHFPSMMIKRHQIQTNKKLSSAELEKLLSKENPFEAVRKV